MVLRITTLEQKSGEEVHAVRNIGALALAPVLLLIAALIIWRLGSDDLTGGGLWFIIWMVLLAALVVVVMACSLRPAEITVGPDRIVIRQTLLTVAFSAISYLNLLALEADESILPDPVRTGSSSYAVVTSSDRTVAKRVPSRRMARQLAQLLQASLDRVRGSAGPAPISTLGP